MKPGRKRTELELGQRFGKLVVIGLPTKREGKLATYQLMQCDCGRQSLMATSLVERGASSSCGCVRRAIFMRGALPRFIRREATKLAEFLSDPSALPKRPPGR